MQRPHLHQHQHYLSVCTGHMHLPTSRRLSGVTATPTAAALCLCRPRAGLLQQLHPHQRNHCRHTQDWALGCAHLRGGPSSAQGRLPGVWQGAAAPDGQHTDHDAAAAAGQGGVWGGAGIGLAGWFSLGCGLQRVALAACFLGLPAGASSHNLLYRTSYTPALITRQ